HIDYMPYCARFLFGLMKLIRLWSLLGVSGTRIQSGHDAFWSLSDGPMVALCLLIWYQIMTCDALWHMKAIIPSPINSEITTGKRSFFREHTWQEDTMSVHAVPQISLRISPSKLVHIL
uniref:Uncharacterized protein n=1 Tax=Aegilops tauschii subsp. strangulata TaxID=200361 RepID=A0A452ZHD6_AEGTS